ncbi:MAG TPA: HemK/PrmC family methyltransferase, partial [Elusimicrobiales bacterium]|nr:HemK/PrmC family methyltransferase [Elusimicrobiales bacterium]
MTAAGALLAEAANALKISGRQEPELNAELLLEYITRKPHLYFRVNPDCAIPADQLRRFKNLLKKRAGGVPLAYLTGSRQFRSSEIKVTTSVLIPRPETEELAGLALSAISCLGKAAPVILDLCTGSGCIACALAQELPDSRIIAADVSAAALRVARANAKKLGLERRVTFRLSDMYETLRG